MLCAIPPLVGYPEGTALRHDLNAQIRGAAEAAGWGFADLFTPIAKNNGSLERPTPPSTS